MKKEALQCIEGHARCIRMRPHNPLFYTDKLFLPRQEVTIKLWPHTPELFLMGREVNGLALTEDNLKMVFKICHVNVSDALARAIGSSRLRTPVIYPMDNHRIRTFPFDNDTIVFDEDQLFNNRSPLRL